MKSESIELPGLELSDRIDTLVEVITEGTVCYITRDLESDPCDGEEVVSLSTVEVRIHGRHCAEEGVSAVVFKRALGTLPVHCQLPEPPPTGRVDQYRSYSKFERVLHLRQGIAAGIHLEKRGILVQDQVLDWDEVLATGEKDWRSLAAYSRGVLLGPEIYEALEPTNEGSTFNAIKRTVVLALLDDIDFIVAQAPSGNRCLDARMVIAAAGDSLDSLFELVFSIPWESASKITGPTTFRNWIAQNHPGSPSRSSTGGN